MLATRLADPVLAARVVRDRQLALVAWRGGIEVGRYCSDPSRETGADKDVIDQPVGADIAVTLAELYGRVDAADELSELLEDELDPDSVYESERLRAVLRLLGLPAWIVAAGALPRDIPTGPEGDGAHPTSCGCDRVRGAHARAGAASGATSADSAAGHRRPAEDERRRLRGLDAVTRRVARAPRRSA